MSETLKVERELTGRHVLIIMLVFFGLIISSSIWFTTLAVTTFRGEDVKKSYRQGLDYNTTLAERAAQSDLGWEAGVNVIGTVEDRALVVRVAEGERAIFGLDYTGRLRHPVDTDLDREITFASANGGSARADLSGLIGQWTLQAVATDGEQTFRFAYPLDLR